MQPSAASEACCECFTRCSKEYQQLLSFSCSCLYCRQHKLHNDSFRSSTYADFSIRLNTTLCAWPCRSHHAVLACSALKPAYRQVLRSAALPDQQQPAAAAPAVAGTHAAQVSWQEGKQQATTGSAEARSAPVVDRQQQQLQSPIAFVSIRDESRTYHWTSCHGTSRMVPPIDIMFLSFCLGSCHMPCGTKKTNKHPAWDLAML